MIRSTPPRRNSAVCWILTILWGPGALKALALPDVRDALNKRYRYVFIDEYQDSSAIQEAIIGSFAREDGLFLVGDVKQSIYRFRQAEPTLFL